MVAGLILGAFVDVAWMGLFIMPLTILMIFPLMMNLQWRALVTGGGKALLLSTTAVHFLLIPFLAFSLAKLFFPGDAVVLSGMVIIGILPTSGITRSSI